MLNMKIKVGLGTGKLIKYLVLSSVHHLTHPITANVNSALNQTELEAKNMQQFSKKHATGAIRGKTYNMNHWKRATNAKCGKTKPLSSAGKHINLCQSAGKNNICQSTGKHILPLLCTGEPFWLIGWLKEIVHLL